MSAARLAVLTTLAACTTAPPTPAPQPPNAESPQPKGEARSAETEVGDARRAAATETVAARDGSGHWRPNVVLILVDDLGWRDLGCYGQDVAKTPHLDHFAAQGMRFTQAYAANPVCSPTRAALLTGKYPTRLGIHDWIPGTQFPTARWLAPTDLDQLPLAETTLAEALRERGYATWHIGKWHLGGEGFLPQDQGFDLQWFGNHLGHPASHFHPYDAGNPQDGHALANLPPGGQPGDYLADVQATTAAALLRGARGRREPFFLYLPFYSVHAPIEAKAADVARYRAEREQRLAAAPAGQRAALAAQLPKPAFAAMLENLDAAVGTVLRALDEAHLAEQTLVVVTSDNGGLSGTSENAPLRGGKRSLWEGGLRVPLLVRWPGVVPAGSTCDLPTITQDVHCGVRAAAGAAWDAAVAADAYDLLPVWRGGAAAPRGPLYWHFPQHQTAAIGPRGAIRDGDWKLIEELGTGETMLFDLAHDPYETTDRSRLEPERCARLRAALQSWRRSLGAAMPTPNPAYVATPPQETP